MKLSAVCAIMMNTEYQACQVICRTEKKRRQIIRQDDVNRLTDKWKIYHEQEIPWDWHIIGHQGDGSNTTEELTTTCEECSTCKTRQAHKACEGCTLASHGNAKVERSVGEQQGNY